MTIPDYQTIMLPMLNFYGDDNEHHIQDAIKHISDLFKLTKEEREKRLPSGKQQVIDNRVGWARTYLKKAGLLKTTRRGYAKITDRGHQVLLENPDKIDNSFLKRFQEFREFRNRKSQTDDFDKEEDHLLDNTPEELLEIGYQEIRKNLINDILEQVKNCSPDFFEKLVIDLLLKMGYGGSQKEAGEAIGKSGDEGIDGIIKEDKLGLDIIYIQAKRWSENSVGRPEIQGFAGALQGKKARKGIFITTSQFVSTAIDYANQIDSKIILIDG